MKNNQKISTIVLLCYQLATAGNNLTLRLLVFLLVVIDDFEVRVDHVLTGFTGSRASCFRLCSAPTGLRTTGLRGSLFIQFGADILEPILQLVCRLLNGVSIVTVELFSDVLDSAFQSLLLISRKPLPKLTQLFFALIRQIIGVVACFRRFARFPVFFRMCLCFLTQSFDFL